MCIPDSNAGFLAAFNANVNAYHSMKVGSYHFFGELSEYSHINEGTPYLMAKAAALFDFEGEEYGVVQSFNISNLVSVLSVGYLNGRNVNGNTLIQRYHGSLMEKKQQFLKEWVIDYAVTVFQEWDSNRIYWKMCNKHDFIAPFENVRCTPEFAEYVDSRSI